MNKKATYVSSIALNKLSCSRGASIVAFPKCNKWNPTSTASSRTELLIFLSNIAETTFAANNFIAASFVKPLQTVSNAALIYKIKVCKYAGPCQ